MHFVSCVKFSQLSKICSNIEFVWEENLCLPCLFSKESVTFFRLDVIRQVERIKIIFAIANILQRVTPLPRILFTRFQSLWPSFQTNSSAVINNWKIKKYCIAHSRWTLNRINFRMRINETKDRAYFARKFPLSPDVFHLKI